MWPQLNKQTVIWSKQPIRTQLILKENKNKINGIRTHNLQFYCLTLYQYNTTPPLRYTNTIDVTQEINTEK